MEGGRMEKVHVTCPRCWVEPPLKERLKQAHLSNEDNALLSQLHLRWGHLLQRVCHSVEVSLHMACARCGESNVCCSSCAPRPLFCQVPHHSHYEELRVWMGQV